MDAKLTVSSSPHIRTDEDTRSIMLDVLIALAFPLAVAVYFFGWRALALTAVSVVSSMLFEWLYRKLMKKTNTAGDLSAAVTGVLIAFVLPASAPYWLPVVGSFFAIVIVKQLYGGIGKNFLNPALAARAFLTSFPIFLAAFTAPLAEKALPLWGQVDAVTSATPLGLIKSAEALSLTNKLPQDYSFMDMFLGQIPGSLGEVSTAVLLLAGLYLIVRKVITPRIPVAFIATVAVLTFLFPRGGVAGLDYMLYNILGGGLMLGAIFMATDYTTSPVTKRGQWIFGIGCGALTVFMRYFSPMPEGVCYAILLMNTIVWLLDKVGMPRRFGVRFASRFTRKSAKGGKDNA